MRHFSKSILFLSGLLFLSPILIAKPDDDRGIRQAIKKGDTEFFKNITLEDFEAGNKPDESGKTLIARMEVDGVNALVGAFNNPNVAVRKKVYKELLYPHIFKDIEGVTVADFMSQDRQLNQYLEKLRAAIYSVDEFDDSEAMDALAALIKQYGYSVKVAIKVRNAKAIALMTPEFFKNSNLEDPKTIIVRFKKRGVKTLVKALEFKPGNPETKKLIIENLYYKTLGGPGKVIKKERTRKLRGENLFLIADKEQNPELRTQLIELAEAYYFAEEEADTEPEKEKENDKTEDNNSQKLSDDDDDDEPEAIIKKSFTKSKKKKRIKRKK